VRSGGSTGLAPTGHKHRAARRPVSGPNTLGFFVNLTQKLRQDLRTAASETRSGRRDGSRRRRRHRCQSPRPKQIVASYSLRIPTRNCASFGRLAQARASTPVAKGFPRPPWPTRRTPGRPLDAADDIKTTVILRGLFQHQHAIHGAYSSCSRWSRSLCLPVVKVFDFSAITARVGPAAAAGAVVVAIPAAGARPARLVQTRDQLEGQRRRGPSGAEVGRGMTKVGVCGSFARQGRR